MKPGIPPIPPELGDEPDVQDLERIWRDLEAARPSPVPVESTDRDWAELKARMGPSALAHELEVRSRPHSIGSPGSSPRGGGSGRAPVPSAVRRTLAAAAVLLLLVSGSLALLGLPGRAVALPGESVTVTLPDGSVAELNSGSTLRWTRSILPGASPVRTYRLAGEAFLDVVPGERPFVVETHNAQITVLGTRFNVRAREELGSGTEVVLEEGRVRLSHGGSGESVELAPGEAAVVDSGAVAPGLPRPVELDRALVWRDRGFSAVQYRLSDILGELSLRYGVEIGLADPVDGSQRLTVHYARLGDLREVLSDLSTARGLRFREMNGGFEVY